jgi:hypothetical protein
MDVLRMVLRQALAVVASGISIGLFSAWKLTRPLGGLTVYQGAKRGVTDPVGDHDAGGIACAFPQVNRCNQVLFGLRV